jgi:hypothetical protein
LAIRSGPAIPAAQAYHPLATMIAPRLETNKASPETTLSSILAKQGDTEQDAQAESKTMEHKVDRKTNSCCTPLYILVLLFLMFPDNPTIRCMAMGHLTYHLLNELWDEDV